MCTSAQEKYPFNDSENSATNKLELFLNIANHKANAPETDEGIVVLEGSEASKDFTVSLSSGYIALREKLIQNNKLKLKDDKYIFQENVLITTASPAAAIVLGYNTNGLNSWKDKNGKSLKEIENERLK